MAVVNKQYRNVVIVGDHVTGECNSTEPPCWYRFSGILSLLKVSHVFNTAPVDVQKRIYAENDAYGDNYGRTLAGHVPPQGMDWSGIRDSSDAAIARMLTIAEEWQGDKPWPWEPVCTVQLTRSHRTALRHAVHALSVQRDELLSVQRRMGVNLKDTMQQFEQDISALEELLLEVSAT